MRCVVSMRKVLYSLLFHYRMQLRFASDTAHQLYRNATQRQLEVLDLIKQAAQHKAADDAEQSDAAVAQLQVSCSSLPIRQLESSYWAEVRASNHASRQPH